MNRQEIRENFEKYADVMDIKPLKYLKSRNGNSRDEMSVRYEDEIIEINNQENSTLGYSITELKPLSNECQFKCGKTVSHQKADYAFHQKPQKHWRTRCLNCYKYIHPNGEDLIHQGYQVHNVYNEYYKS